MDIESALTKDCRVDIYFGSPADHGRQVLRPYEYRIQDAHLDELRSSGTRFMGNMRTLDGTDFSGIILPSIKATDIRTSAFGELYRFTMVVKRPRLVAGGGAMGRRESVQTYVGYFYEPPFGVMNGQVTSTNRQAAMVITNSSEMQNMTGESLITKQAIDVAHPAHALQTDKTLYRCDVSQLAPDVTDVEGSETFGGIMPHRPLNDPGEGARAASVARSSVHSQLGMLAKGVLTCETAADTHMVARGAGMSRFQLHPEGRSMDENIRTTFAESVVDSSANLRTSGLDMVSQSLMLGDIIDTYGEHNVFPHPVGTLVREWDVLDPSMGTVESQASVIAAAAVREICSMFRLQSLGFIYATNRQLIQKPEDMIGRNTVGDLASDSYFAITSLQPWVEKEEVVELQKINQAAIHMELDSTVAPVLRSLANGDDFVLLVENMVGDRCLTNVEYASLDYGRGRRECVYFEHHNRLAGLTSPIVGDNVSVKVNADAIGNVMHKVSAAGRRLAEDYNSYAELDAYEDSFDPYSSRPDPYAAVGDHHDSITF